MRRLIRKFVLGTVSVLALGIGGAALDSAINSRADAGNMAAAVRMPSQTSDSLGTSDSLRKDDIRWAQTELRDRGLYKGSLDGVLGPQTKRALAEFQQNNDLIRTALLDAQTWEVLTGGPGIAQGSSVMPPENHSSGLMTNSSPASDLGK